MNEVLTVEAVPAETALYFAPGNTSVGRSPGVPEVLPVSPQQML